MKRFIALAVLLVPVAFTPATLIEYAATNVSGTTWQYEYTVTNDSLATALEGFTVYFDYTLFTNITVGPDQPAGWDSITIPPDPGLPDDGFFDSLALTVAGIAPGDTLGGFTVLFDYFGSDAPGSQPFEIYNLDPFVVLESGNTSVEVIDPPVTMPEPALPLLLLTGGLAAFSVGRRRS